MEDEMAGEDAQARIARADLCRFLAACYYEPTSAFAEEHIFGSMAAAAARIHPDLAAQAQKLGEAFAAQDLQTLLVDYTRLFLGPVQALAAPYGSVWLARDAALMQDSTMAVLECYRALGFDVDDGFSDLPDHVAVELEFLYLLIFSENPASNDDTGKSVRQLRRRFLSEHLGAWIEPFTASVQSAAQTAFYRELAALTRRFVRMEAMLPPPH